jgi:hypothetical protein
MRRPSTICETAGVFGRGGISRGVGSGVRGLLAVVLLVLIMLVLPLGAARMGLLTFTGTLVGIAVIAALYLRHGGKRFYDDQGPRGTRNNEDSRPGGKAQL